MIKVKAPLNKLLFIGLYELALTLLLVIACRHLKILWGTFFARKSLILGCRYLGHFLGRWGYFLNIYLTIE